MLIHQAGRVPEVGAVDRGFRSLFRGSRWRREARHPRRESSATRSLSRPRRSPDQRSSRGRGRGASERKRQESREQSQNRLRGHMSGSAAACAPLAGTLRGETPPPHAAGGGHLSGARARVARRWLRSHLGNRRSAPGSQRIAPGRAWCSFEKPVRRDAASADGSPFGGERKGPTPRCDVRPSWRAATVISAPRSILERAKR